jgi:hypothetical protein
VKDAVLKFVNGNLKSDIHENTNIGQDGLEGGLRALRPDMVFEREGRGGRMLEILEFSCPYGYVSHERDTLAAVYEQKRAKYSELANALGRLRQQPVNVTAVIVSSMGAVYPKSLKELRKILCCTSREIRKLGRRMSNAAITGSMKIWHQFAQNMRREPMDGEGEDPVIQQERMDAIEMEGNGMAEEAEGVEEMEPNSEEVSGDEEDRNERRRNERDDEPEDGESGEANPQEQIGNVAEVAEPATDEDQDDSEMALM